MYRVLQVACGFGYFYSTRTPYGSRDKEVSIYEDYDGAEIWAGDLIISPDGVVKFHPNDDYYRRDFNPKSPLIYNDELNAELRNEEALYGYREPRF